MPATDTVLDVVTAQQIFGRNISTVVAISILFYDHLVTSGTEVEYIWRRAKKRSAYLFFLNRYFVLCSVITQFVLSFEEFSPERCNLFILVREVALILNQTIVSVLLALRLYALYHRPSWMIWFMGGSAAVSFGVGGLALYGQKNSPTQIVPQQLGCHFGISFITGLYIAAPWQTLFVYDSTLFSLMIRHTWKEWHGNCSDISRRTFPIYYTIIRDGTIYFAVMALANLSNILTFYLCGPFMRGGLSTFANVVSSTMMSRHMLNLHQTTDIGIYSTSRMSQFVVESRQDMA